MRGCSGTPSTTIDNETDSRECRALCLQDSVHRSMHCSLFPMTHSSAFATGVGRLLSRTPFERQIAKLRHRELPKVTSTTRSDSIDTEGFGQLNLPGTERGSDLPLAELAALIEAFLLVAAEPPTIEELAAGANTQTGRVEAALAHLVDHDDRGWILQRHGDRIQLATAPRFASYLRTFLGLDREARLSSAAMETLAIVAYQQPATRAEIEMVRGVDCSGVLATLHARGLIEPISRRPTVGNPIQYGTSADFLKHFGLRSLADLPPIGQIDGVEGRRVLESAMETDAPEPEVDADRESDRLPERQRPEEGDGIS